MREREKNTNIEILEERKGKNEWRYIRRERKSIYQKRENKANEEILEKNK